MICAVLSAGPFSGAARAESLLLELGGAAAPWVDDATVVRELSQADLASVGETHGRGLERGLIADLYRALKPAKSAKGCVVENYGGLVVQPGAGDPVLVEFSRLCPRKKILDHPTFDFTAPLKKALSGKSDRAISHSGNRHILPLGRLYGEDFPIATWSAGWVDRDARGTMGAQMPAEFVRRGRRHRAAFHFDWDTLVVERLGRGIAEIVELTARGEDPRGAMDRAAAGLTEAFARLGDRRAPWVELGRIPGLFPGARGFARLVHDPGFEPARAQALLGSTALLEFARRVDPRRVQVSRFRGDDGSAYQVGGRILVRPNSIIVFGEPREPGRPRQALTDDGEPGTWILEDAAL